MAKKFELSISLGNDAMQYGEDIADVLHKVAYTVEQQMNESGPIYDCNGNKVGEWRYR